MFACISDCCVFVYVCVWLSAFVHIFSFCCFVFQGDKTRPVFMFWANSIHIATTCITSRSHTQRDRMRAQRQAQRERKLREASRDARAADTAAHDQAVGGSQSQSHRDRDTGRSKRSPTARDDGAGGDDADYVPASHELADGAEYGGGAGTAVDGESSSDDTSGGAGRDPGGMRPCKHKGIAYVDV